MRLPKNQFTNSIYTYLLSLAWSKEKQRKIKNKRLLTLSTFFFSVNCFQVSTKYRLTSNSYLSEIRLWGQSRVFSFWVYPESMNSEKELYHILMKGFVMISDKYLVFILLKKTQIPLFIDIYKCWAEPKLYVTILSSIKISVIRY